MVRRVFLLSPARCDGERAKLLFNPQAGFDLAVRLRSAEGATLGETFSFLSGLYFRGKLGYAARFAAALSGLDPVLVITTHRGLLPADTRITMDDLRAMAEVPIDLGEARFVEPLRRDAERVSGVIGGAGEAVLLGSIASAKYVDVLLPVLGDRLTFPAEFVGRGDMSRGGLLLRCVAEGRELETIAVSGAVRRGKRPPRLAPLPRGG